MIDLNTIPSDFGHWLAGFVDGEGCFQLKQNPANGCWYSRFEIGVRADEIGALLLIHQRLGLGRVYNKSARGSTRPSVHLVVTRKDECADVANLFERFPLRAKKARDFAIWAEAVRVHEAGTDWETIASLAEQLRKVRQYRAPDQLAPAFG